MRQFSVRHIACLTLSVASIFSIVSADTTSTTAPKAAVKEFFVIETSHRLFPNFKQIDTVALNQQFEIDEGQNSAQVILFNPHLGITDSGKMLQLSDTLYNPAVRMQVSEGDKVVQESWAFFLAGAPHYRRNDLLGFRLLEFKVDPKYVMPPLKPGK
ncbi:MAG: hypothetical protein AAB305_06095 [Candidatus Zixiibacteriota bacterium]